MALLATLLTLVAIAILIALGVSFLGRFYRKSSRDVALVRTGYGGQAIVLSGGCLALPFLHKVDEVNMRTLRLEVQRTGNQSVITEDRMRVDVTLEFYLRVEPTVDGVATAAQSLGSRTLTADGLRNLMEGRFVDAIQSVAATETMDTLHERRAGFVEKIAAHLRVNLAANGLVLDSVSLTRLDQAPFGALDENNAFNAVGMRRLAEIIAVNKKKRAEIEADADVSVRHTELDATKRRLDLEREREEAQFQQSLGIERAKAASGAEAVLAREQAMQASENARIQRELETRAAELAKQRDLREIEIGAQLDTETRKVDSAIALAARHVEEAEALARSENARVQIVLAKEQVQTERERAVAGRSRELALMRVREAGEVAASNAESESHVLLAVARAEAEAVRTRADADKLRMLAESEGNRSLIDAENARSEALMAMNLEQYRLDRLPGIVAELVRPAEKIDSIRIHQVSGFGSSTGGGGGGGNGDARESGDKAPVNQVMDGILGMSLQLPALKSIGQSIGYDFDEVFRGIDGTRRPATDRARHLNGDARAAPDEHE